ncbi:uncharacterized protein LOC105389641 [Plutella xylostella]|uniref:uncharacterized protein LOC105389641 n=1 Tax=Plutella xylostella TaxID=51655 RepID=UPI002032D28A|nr:uncharacterized protein LOC105389641 [Plutella xylostella]
MFSVTEFPISHQYAMQQCHRIFFAPSEVSFKRPREDVFSVPDFLTSLPVKDDESFCHLNDQLKDTQNKQAIVKFLAGIGGKNPRSLTTNLLRRILLDVVAQQYSLTGKKMKNSDKKSFLVTETCQIIFHICKNVYADATEETLKEIIGDWLNQAKVRLSRRAERQKK